MKSEAKVVEVGTARIYGVVERTRASFGFIRGEDNVVRMFIPSLLRDWTKFDEFVEGTQVEFLHTVTDKGFRASDVTLRGEDGNQD